MNIRLNNKSALLALQALLFVVVYLFLSGELFSQQLQIDEVKFIHKDTATFADNVLSDAVDITKEKLYNYKILGEDILKLKKFYFDNGFFDAQIDTAVQYNYAAENVSVSFIIKENKRYRIDSLIYKGLETVKGDLKKRVDSVKTIKNKDFYNKVLIIQQSNEIVDLLQNNGYMNAGIKKDSGTTVIKYDSSINVLIYFTGSDSIFRFGKTTIDISQNVYGVDPNIFTKVITYSEGNIYDKSERLATERNMSKYAIVQSARLEAQTINNGTVDFSANILLNKQHMIAPYIEATNIDNNFYIGGGARYVDRYFLGGGRSLSLEFHGLFHSTPINRIEFLAAVTQPNVFNNHSSLIDKVTVGLYNVEGYKDYYLGNLTTVNYSISDHTFYSNASASLDEELVRFNYQIDSIGTLTQFNSFLSATIAHDNTNSVSSPSGGFYHSITVGDGGLLSKLLINLFSKNVYYSQFYKLYTANRFYFDISKLISATVFAAKFNVGEIIEYGGGDRVLPVQPIYRFFSGGSNSLRGWNAKMNGVLDDRLAGGEFQLEGSFELRKRLFPKSESFSKNIGMALFLDYGNVWETHKDFRFNQIALAIGLGARYDLFLGPVRIDLGFKLYDPTDRQNEKWLFTNLSRLFKDKFAITFGIGQSF